MSDGVLDGMQHFDGELERLAREGTISLPTAYLYATNAGRPAGDPGRRADRVGCAAPGPVLVSFSSDRQGLGR